MKVFVWNWQGVCLGKLFDADNIGICKWNFQKNDCKRQVERHHMIDELLKELDLPVQKKAQRRRQTLYQNHLQRKSQKDLPHASVMLLDHIVSQHPEVAAMEMEEEGEDRGKELVVPKSSDAKIIAEMDKVSQRNYTAKRSMLETLKRGSIDQSSLSLSSCSSASVATPPAVSLEMARMQSLAQVGPLLCVDKFESKQTLEQMKFPESDELTISRQYLEDELATHTSSMDSTGSSGGTKKSRNSLATIKTQIRHAQHHAEEMLQTKMALRRHASAMYANLERGGQRRSSGDSSSSSKTNINASATGGADLTDAMLEPSPFLKQNLPSHVLTIRPQTAPSPQLKSRSSSSSSLLRAGNSSNSTAPAIKKPPLLSALPKSTSSMIGGHHRRSTLDQMYVEEIQRQQQQHPSPAKQKRLSHLQDGDGTDDNGDGHVFEKDPLKKLDTINAIISRAQQVVCAPVAAASGSGSMVMDAQPAAAAIQRPASASPSLGIGKQTRGPTTSNSMAGRAKSALLPTLHETEDGNCISRLVVVEPADKCSAAEDDDVQRQTLRAHLQTTQRRMEQAMKDNENTMDDAASSHRSLAIANKKRLQLAQLKKDKRMEDYLQQKRRELNTNIGAVFKRTSFAFPMSGGGGDGAEGDAGKSTSKGKRKQNDPAAGHHGRGTALQVEKSKVFGIYGVREVMSLIRLFATMDEDDSGVLTLDELLAYKSYFEKLGYHDMATVFQSIDKDGSGSITLKELLEVCFQYATPHQVDEMVKLAKLGNVAAYFDAASQGGRRKSAHKQQDTATTADDSSSSTTSTSTMATPEAASLTAEQRAELRAIFHVFDRDGDGGVSMEEIIDALHIDDDELRARVEAVEDAKLAQRASSSKKLLSSSSTCIGTTTLTSKSTSGFTREDVRKLYQDFDHDGSKSLEFDEFVLLMQTLYGPSSKR